MERGKLFAIAGGKAPAKTILLALVALALGQYLLASILLEMLTAIQHTALALCDSLRKLEQIQKDARASSYTVTVSPTPAMPPTDASAPLSPAP